MAIKDYLPSIRRSDGKLDAVAVFLSLLTFSIFALAVVLYRQEATPTFEFLDDTAPVLNEGDIAPGEDLIIELHFKSQNELGKTDIFGQLACFENRDGEQVTIFSKTIEFGYSINVGGKEPFSKNIPWSIPTPDDMPRGAECEYRHAAVLANGSIQTIGASFVTSD